MRNNKRGQTSSNLDGGKSIRAIIGLPLITVWLQVRVLPGPLTRCSVLVGPFHRSAGIGGRSFGRGPIQQVGEHQNMDDYHGRHVECTPR